MPSRAGLLSGRYQPRFGVDGNGDELSRFDAQTTIAARLKKAGYATGMTGKWHLGPPPKITTHGFDDVFCNQGAPGKAWANFNMDGKPIKSLALMYDPASTPNSHKDMRAAMGAYFACISFMDAQVGVLLDAMDRLKLWDNTIVVFMSDHGYHLGEHAGMWHKGSVFEECSRAPLIVAAPGAKRGAVSPRLVEYVDIYPTLVDFCGMKVPDDLEGTSFVPLLKEPDRAWKQAAFCQVLMPAKPKDKMGRSLCTERWHYIEWNDGADGVQLYDHSNDPHEYANLAHDAQHADVVREMAARLKAGWKQSMPPLPTQ